MSRHTIILATGLIVTLAGSLSASRVNARTPECPDVFVFGSDCTELNAVSQCQNFADGTYGDGCTVLCASCSSLGNYNCKTDIQQCQQ